MSSLWDRGAVYRTSELTAMNNHQDTPTQKLVGLTQVSTGAKTTHFMQRFFKKKSNLVVNQLIY